MEALGDFISTSPSDERQRAGVNNRVMEIIYHLQLDCRRATGATSFRTTSGV